MKKGDPAFFFLKHLLASLKREIVDFDWNQKCFKYRIISYIRFRDLDLGLASSEL